MKRISKISFIAIMCFVVIGIVSIFGINGYVKYYGGKKVVSSETAAKLNDIDCIIVLGCGVTPTGKPSLMLEDRLKRGIELYNQEAADKILMSGDHGEEFYDEVNTMKQFAIDAGVPSGDIFMDHAGFSTYESMYRAKEIFGVDTALIVSQKYHLYRAIYIAEKLGINAYGVNTDERIYGGEKYREIRELLARVKDFEKAILRPEPTYMGEVIPISGDGNVTND